MKKIGFISSFLFTRFSRLFGILCLLGAYSLS